MTPDEMRAGRDWQHAWHEAQYGSYGPGYDWENDKEGSAPEDFALAQVVEVVAADDGENDEEDWICITKMSDGRFAVMSAGCDYTGWDCRAGGRIDYFDTLQEACSQNALLEKYRHRLKKQIEARGIAVDWPAATE